MENIENTIGVTSQAYIPRNVIAVVTRNLKDADVHLSAAIKHLIEVSPSRITGLKTSFQLIDSGIDYEDSQPVFYWPERVGKVVLRSLTAWVKAQGGKVANGKKNPDFGIDVMFIETDAICKNVVDAWYCKGLGVMKVNGPEGQRDVESAQKTPVLAVKFFAEVGTLRETKEVQDYATELLKSMNVAGISPFHYPNKFIKGS